MRSASCGCNQLYGRGAVQSGAVENDFISSVSHELRTPLTAIKGWAETLADEEGLTRKRCTKAWR